MQRCAKILSKTLLDCHVQSLMKMFFSQFVQVRDNESGYQSIKNIQGQVRSQLSRTGFGALPCTRRN